jgi:hypothetical protein
MGKCKNIECDNKTENKRVYCSLSCRNYYVNKYLRDYSKNGEGLSKEVKDKYETNPKYCKNIGCGKKISYEKRRNEYCGGSCSASHTNTLREVYHRKPLSGVALENIKLANRKQSEKKTGDKFSEYVINPNICLNCSEALQYALRKRKYCNTKCRKMFKRKDMDEFLIYKAETKFNFGLSNYPDEFDFGLVEEHGWYSPSNSKKPNLNGVSRDHMLSVREGFNNGVDPKLLSHPANCKLMAHTDNISKNKNSSITESELKSRIYNWNNKY